MNAAIEMLARAPHGPAILGWTGGGLLLQLIVVLLVLRSALRTARMSEEVEQLALEGQVQKARIRAREGSSRLVPLVSALSGGQAQSSAGPVRSLLAACLIVALPAAGAVAAAFGTWAPGTHLALASSHVVLVPSGLMAGRLVILMNRWAIRRVRGACAVVIEDVVRIETERRRNAARRRNVAAES